MANCDILKVKRFFLAILTTDTITMNVEERKELLTETDKIVNGWKHYFKEMTKTNKIMNKSRKKKHS